MDLTEVLSYYHAMEGFLGCVPARIGHCKTVDAAACAVVKAFRHTALRPGSAQDVATRLHYAADLSYVKAVSRLRLALAGTEPRQDYGDSSILSAALLVIADKARKVPYDGHVDGITTLLLTHNRDQTPTPLARGVMYWHVLGTFQTPTARGEASPFESDAWLEAVDLTAKDPEPAVRRLSTIGNQLYIRLPRLVALVRAARVTASDVKASAEATALASTILGLDDSLAESEMLHTVRVTKTSDPSDAHMVPFSFSFPTPGHFLCATKYWQNRLLLNRLCLRLQELLETQSLLPPRPPKHPFNTERIRTENLRLATNIMMCAQYTFRLFALGSHGLRIALIALWAMTKDLGREFRKGLPTADVRTWTLQRFNDLHRVRSVYAESQMDDAAELLAGGPLKGFLLDVLLKAPIV